MNPIQIKFKNKTYYGYTSCPSWLRKKYLDAVGNKCERTGCNKTEHLEIHRVIRGVENGYYDTFPVGHMKRNWRVYCHAHHSELNYSRKLPAFTTKKENIHLNSP